jgi:hypothetical protein
MLLSVFRAFLLATLEKLMTSEQLEAEKARLHHLVRKVYRMFYKENGEAFPVVRYGPQTFWLGRFNNVHPYNNQTMWALIFDLYFGFRPIKGSPRSDRLWDKLFDGRIFDCYAALRSLEACRVEKE